MRCFNLSLNKNLVALIALPILLAACGGPTMPPGGGTSTQTQQLPKASNSVDQSGAGVVYRAYDEVLGREPSADEFSASIAHLEESAGVKEQYSQADYAAFAADLANAQ